MRSMRIRIQPVAVEVPDDEPFKHDLLYRKEPAGILASLVGSVEGPCVMGIDVLWGAGKTTFLKMWAQHMRNQGFPVVEFNAWETDFSQDPFIALSSELQQSLNAYISEDSSGDASPQFDQKKVQEFNENVSQVAIQILNQQQISNQLIVHGDYFQLYGGPLNQSTSRSVIQKANKLKDDQADCQNGIKQEMQGQNTSNQKTQGHEELRCIEYQKTIESFKALRDSLRAVVAQSLEDNFTRPSDNVPQSGEPDSEPDSFSQFEGLDSQSGDNDRPSEQRKPLVVFIDELDRCRPTYAIELLEVAKHLFAVDGVVFVLGVNRSELAESVKAVYGASFNAEGYLHRFFDIDIRLPSPDRKAFIESQLKAIRLDAFLARTQDKHASKDFGHVQDMLLTFFGLSTLSLRDVEQAIHRLGVVLTLTRSDQWSFIISAMVLVILRTIDRNAYYDLVNGNASDRQIIEKVFNLPSMEALRYDNQYRNEALLFEAMIIICSVELKYPSDHPGRYKPLTSTSDMYKHYDEVINSEDSVGGKESSADTIEKEARENAELVSSEAVSRPSTYTDQQIEHARKLIQKVTAIEHLLDNRMYEGYGFATSIKRLELIWADSSNH